MELHLYFDPIDEAVLPSEQSRNSNQLGSAIFLHADDTSFPDLNGIKIAIIGVPEERGAVSNPGCAFAADIVRKKLYGLYSLNFPNVIADLGNLKVGSTLNDTYSALSNICSYLIKNRTIPVIIGGSQDLTYAQYLAFTELDQTVNIVAVDSKFDLGTTEEKISAENYLGKIIMHEPNYLFNFSNIGYQTYFAGSDALNMMQNMYFDTYRLGEVRARIEETEPIIRNADVLSFDMTAIRASDAPANKNATPNGLYGEEACRIIRYAGLSDKLSTIGFYELNPDYDLNERSAHLAAQMIWFFIEGYFNRKSDFPVSSKTGFVKYRVNVKNTSHEIIFYKSKKSDRWWMEVPYPQDKMRFQRHHIIPCSYADYETACKEEMPERWWQAFQKLS